MILLLYILQIEYNFKENIKFLIDHLNIMDYKNNSLKKKNFYRYIL